MLGVALLFVAIVLIMNGVNRFLNVDAKSTAVMNLITGTIIVIGNFIMLAWAGASNDYQGFQNVASGFLFGFTYLFIAGNYLLKLDLRPFGWFSLCVAVYAGIMSVSTFATSGADVRYGILWAAWAVLWLEGFLELSLHIKKLGKVFPYLSILEGIFAAGLPSVLMLMGKW